MKSKPLRRTRGALPLAAIAGLALTTSSTIAGVINIDNAGFENGGGSASGGNWAMADNWVEDLNPGSVYVDGVLERVNWKPEADRVLYLNANTAVNQDLGHSWSASDSYTLGLVGHEAGWRVGAASDDFSVQLRQTDGTVLWDSGTQNVDGTLTGTQSNLTYTGVGHIFSWTIDAGTFTAGTEGQPLNIRILGLSGTPYIDDVSLSVTGPDLIAPGIASASPADDATAVSPSSDLVATFSEDIALTGNGSVTIRDLGPGPDVVINLSGPDPDGSVSAFGTDLTINPTADLNLNTDYAIQISADAVEDLAANPFAGILDDTTWNFQTIAEATPPTLVSTSPVDDAPAVVTNSNLVATFDETVTAGTGNITIKNLTEATDTVLPMGDDQVSVSGMKLTINPSTDLDPGDDYAIQIEAGAIKDTVGNPYAGILAPDVTTWNFTTDADTVDPAIIALSPVDNAPAVVESSYLVATFDELIALGAGDITIKNLSDETQSVISVNDPEVSIFGDTLTIDPGTNFDFGDDYAVQIGANAITDLSGNPFAGIGDDMKWNFTTRVMPTFINISNAGFEGASGAASGGNYASPTDWTEENEGSVFVDGVDERTTWKPEADRVLYLGGDGAAVNRDLGHNWSSGEIYTLSLIGQEAGWRVGIAGDAFSVQLRQTDGTVLWDSGTQDVDGTVAGSQGNFSYTGTGHLFSWSIDASSFAGAGVVEGSGLNLRIAQEGGVPYMDDVSLDVSGSSAAASLAITAIELGPEADSVTLTWRNSGAANYIVKYSPDLSSWGADLDDDITPEDDQNPDDAEHITVTFLLTGGLENELKLFFRIEESRGN